MEERAEVPVLGMAPLSPLPDQTESWLGFRDPLSFDEATERVLSAHGADGKREDLVTSLHTWMFFSPDDEKMAVRTRPVAGRAEAGCYLRENAFTQLCSLYGAPARYVRTLPYKIQLATMNWHMNGARNDVMIRCTERKEGRIARAIVSDQYAPIDDQFVLEEIDLFLKTSGYKNDVVVRSIATGKYTALRITIPSYTTKPRIGEIIESGIDITNCELGLKSFRVTPVTMNLICLNGARSTHAGVRKRINHRGDPKRVRERIADAIPVAFSEAKGDLKIWEKSVEIQIENALEEVEGLTGVGLNQKETVAVGQQLLLSAGLERSINLREVLNSTNTTVYDVANAITSVAQQADVNHRLELEESGYRYLKRRVERRI